MRRVLILGAGDAGTTVANKLRRRLGNRDWTITVVDRDRPHLYGPALPSGEAGSENLFRPRRKALRRGVSFVLGEADQVVPHAHHVLLTDGRRLDFDYLVVATGSKPRPERIASLVGPQWRRTVHECSRAGGAIALVTMPKRTGADYIGRSGLGTAANLIAVQPATLRSTAHADIFAVGTAAEPTDAEATTMGAAAFADVFVRLSAGLPVAVAPPAARWRRMISRTAQALRQWKG